VPLHGVGLNRAIYCLALNYCLTLNEHPYNLRYPQIFSLSSSMFDPVVIGILAYNFRAIVTFEWQSND